jgi:tetratricopeptide (TPR) repeat protein
VRPSRLNLIWVCGALCLAAVTGCKSGGGMFAGGGDSTGASVSSTTTPGSGEFATVRKLKDPEATHLIYAQWMEERNPSDARASYQQVLEKNPKSVEALLGLSRIEQLNGRNDAAEKLLARAKKLRPEDPLVTAAYGLYYANQKDWDRALEHLRRAREMGDGDKVYDYQLGAVLVKSGDIAGGLKELEHCGTAAEAHYNAGFILKEQKRLPEAEEQFALAAELDPDLTQAQKMLAVVQEQRGVITTKNLADRGHSPVRTAGGTTENAWSAPAPVEVNPSRRKTDGRKSSVSIEPMATLPF